MLTLGLKMGHRNPGEGACCYTFGNLGTLYKGKEVWSWALKDE